MTVKDERMTGNERSTMDGGRRTADESRRAKNEPMPAEVEFVRILEDASDE